MDIGTKVEGAQAAPPINLFHKSGFSQEDLVSNLLGFYMAITKYKVKEDMEPILGIKVQDERAREVMRDVLGGNLGLNRNKNRHHRPVYLNQFMFAGEGDTPPPMVWPSELTPISPAPYGVLWWTPLAGLRVDWALPYKYRLGIDSGSLSLDEIREENKTR